MKRLGLVLLLVCSTAQAQQAWNENRLTWEAPVACTNGQPIANCAVTNYRVERSATLTGSYTTVGTSTALTFTHNVATAGPSCYRVIAISANGESGPSPTACKTNVQPPPPIPNPPTNLQFVTVSAVTHSLINATPIVRILTRTDGTKHAGEDSGLVPLNRLTRSQPLFKHRGKQWCEVEVSSKEVYVTKTLTGLAAPCAPRA